MGMTAVALPGAVVVEVRRQFHEIPASWKVRLNPNMVAVLIC
ncbi:MAG: hypothetical protein R3E60_04760 [Alphaproteobacteria bacterium]